MSSSSDTNGRAFEAIVFQLLTDTLKNLSLPYFITPEAFVRQKSDVRKLNLLAKKASNEEKSRKTHKDFQENTYLIVDWILEKFQLKTVENITLDKLSDVEGGRGDITDIRLLVEYPNSKKTVNLSLKNKSEALKHSRIGPIPSWIGFTDKKHPVRVAHHQNIIETWNIILNKIKALGVQNNIPIVNFNDLALLNPYIEKYDEIYKAQHIYPCFYKIVEEFFISQSNSEKNVQLLFRYLMGFNYYKIINYDKYIKIIDFTEFTLPTKVEFSRDININNGYLTLVFNNGFEIAIRLHNGDNKLNHNLKCDAQLVNLEELDIPITKILKAKK